MVTNSISERLQAWRDAERRWERPGSTEEVRARALEVIAAWAAYQDACLPVETDELMLVTDETSSYVAATKAAERVLGYEPAELIGQTVADLAAPDLRGATPAQWSAFLLAGRQEGSFRLRAKDGREVALRFQARAHHPIPGFHMSRLWPDPGSRSDQASM